jgi:hypothetical protein
MTDLEDKARVYGMTPEELSVKENNIKQVLEIFMPNRNQDLYKHIIYRVLDEAYLKKGDESK